MTQFVYHFEAITNQMQYLAGGKGMSLANLTKLHLPTPPGFVITTAAHNEYLNGKKSLSPDLWFQIQEGIKLLEQKTGKYLGSPNSPLLLSVRSGAAISMPGMLDTILNVGLNEQVAEGLLNLTGDYRLVWSTCSHFARTFGEKILNISVEKLDQAFEQLEVSFNIRDYSQLIDQDVLSLIFQQETLDGIPEDPLAQLRLSIERIFESWMNNKAVQYRRLKKIRDDIGTAIIVQMMVFGNFSQNSGTGVIFTRDPNTGSPDLYGEYLPNTQGDDIVAGSRTPYPIAYLYESMPDVYNELLDIARQLEKFYCDMLDIEFTVEQGKLFILQTRVGERTNRAAIKIAVDMVNDGIISHEQALTRISLEQLEQLHQPIIDPSVNSIVLAVGLAASPGIVSGVVTFDINEAELRASNGYPVVLVRNETSPDDLPGMIAAQAIVTAKGGVTSHAAVVARGLGKCCVVGCGNLLIDYPNQLCIVKDHIVHAGEWITVDGHNGKIFYGKLPTIDPDFDKYYNVVKAWIDNKGA